MVSPEYEAKRRSKAAKPQAAISEDVVSKLAYDLWERAGRPPGDGKEFWYEARRQLEAK